MRMLYNKRIGQILEKNYPTLTFTQFLLVWSIDLVCCIITVNINHYKDQK